MYITQEKNDPHAENISKYFPYFDVRNFSITKRTVTAL